MSFSSLFPSTSLRFRQFRLRDPAQPPQVFHYVPFIGCAISYGLDPLGFFERCRITVRLLLFSSVEGGGRAVQTLVFSSSTDRSSNSRFLVVQCVSLHFSQRFALSPPSFRLFFRPFLPFPSPPVPLSASPSLTFTHHASTDRRRSRTERVQLRPQLSCEVRQR
jgi:hypothetical protein